MLKKIYPSGFFLAIVICLSFGINQAEAASITSSATGNWASTTSWIGGVVPVDGDTVVIANGHVITIATSTVVTIGDASTSTIPALQSATSTNGTGRLHVAASSTLNLHGNVVQGASTWFISQGATIDFQHATTNLTWQICDATCTNSRLVLSGGTGVNRIFVKASLAANGGGFGNVTGTKFVRGGMLQATGVSFDNIGTASKNFLDFRPDSGYVGYFDDCLFSDSGTMTSSATAVSGAVFRFLRTTFRTPVGTNSQILSLLLASGSHTNVVFDRVRWEGLFSITGSAATGVTWSDMVGQSHSTNAPMDMSSAPPSGTADLVLLYNDIAQSGLPSRIMNGTITRLMSGRDIGGSTTNGHSMTIDLVATTTIVGGFWEMTQPDTTGDQLQLVNIPSTYKTLTVTDIVSPPAGSQASGSMLNVSIAGTNANARIIFEKNTGYVHEFGDAGGAIKTENTNLAAGVFSSVRDNLWWRATSGLGWGIWTQGVQLPADGSYTNVNYNARYNLSSDGYEPADSKFTNPSPPGTNDLVGVNPNFIDSTRNILTWGQSVSGSITNRQQIIDELMKVNDDSGWNPAFNLTDLYTWTRAGFAPQAGAYATSGFGGARIGAMDVVDITAPAVSVTAPLAAATVSGSSVSITASSSDNIALAGVQFKLNTNTNIGSEDTTSTYGVTWDSTAVSDGAHTIIAVARDTAGNYATSTAINITVSNPVAVVATPSSGGSSIQSGSSSTRRESNLQTLSTTSTTNTSSTAPSSSVVSLINQNRALFIEMISAGLTLPSFVTDVLNLTSSIVFQFTRDLQFGSVGEEVRSLQAFLIGENKGPRARALSDHGTTPNFATLTRSALIEYQASAGIVPASGYFGPITRAYLNGLIR